MRTITSDIMRGLLLAAALAAARPACADIEDDMRQLAIEIELQGYEAQVRHEELLRELQPRAPARLPTHYTPPFAGQKLVPHPWPCSPPGFAKVMWLPADWGDPVCPAKSVNSQGE